MVAILDVGVYRGIPRHLNNLVVRSARPPLHHGKVPVVILHVHADAEADLLQVGETTGSPGLFAGLGEYGKEYCGENRNDCNDYEQLNKGKSTSILHDRLLPNE